MKIWTQDPNKLETRIADIPLSQALRRDDLNTRLTNLGAERVFVESRIITKRQVDQDTTADEAELTKVTDNIIRIKAELSRLSSSRT